MSFILNADAPIGQLNAPLQIRTASRDVIASGTVITGDNKNLEIQLAHLRIVFSFLSDGGTTRLESGPSSSESLNLTLWNFNNSIGSGTTAPIEIGNLSGRRLWLAFMVYALNPESTKTVHYTFMLGDAV